MVVSRGTNNTWTFDPMNNLFVDLWVISALASVTYILDLDAYVLHLGDEKSIPWLY